MSEAFGEALEAYESSGEAYEATGEAYEGEGEAYEGEGAGEAGYEAYGEDARSDARRRARQRQIMIARQRQAPVRRQPTGGPPPRRAAATGPSPAMQAIRADVRAMDVDTQATLMRLRRALEKSNRMAYRNAWVAELSTEASQLLDSFHGNLEEHDWARALIRGLPDLLLDPGNPGGKRGLERIVLDPRFGGTVLLAATWAVGHFTGSTDGTGVATLQVPPGPITVSIDGGPINISALALNRQGDPVPTATITWTSQDPTTAQVNPSTGLSTQLSGLVVGSTYIGVSAQGAKTQWISVLVQP